MARDPNQIGTIWLKEGTGKGAGNTYFNGKVFDIPQDGIDVKLVPFTHVRDDGSLSEGWNVIKLA